MGMVKWLGRRHGDIRHVELDLRVGIFRVAIDRYDLTGDQTRSVTTQEHRHVCYILCGDKRTHGCAARVALIDLIACHVFLLPLHG